MEVRPTRTACPNGQPRRWSTPRRPSSTLPMLRRTCRIATMPSIEQGGTPVAAVSFDPYDPSLVDDPWAVYATLRAESPAYFNEAYPFWALSRFADVKEALSDHGTYCSSQG